jgi:DNA/RNA endonuclease YhcR with UshA esterase domain
MKRLITATTVALACSVGLSAQSAKVKSETEIAVKDGKSVTVTGCVERAASGTGFVLTSAEGKDVASRHYLLVGKDDSMDEHVGHLVEIKGRAADVGGDSKVEVKTKTKIEREHADDKETESKTEMKGDLDNVPYLGVKSVKTIRESCN